MKFFVYPLSQDAMEDYLNACNEANRRYALLVEQEKLLRPIVDDVSEVDGLVASIQNFNSYKRGHNPVNPTIKQLGQE